jgi:hypothetical protein
MRKPAVGRSEMQPGRVMALITDTLDRPLRQRSIASKKPAPWAPAGSGRVGNHNKSLLPAATVLPQCCLPGTVNWCEGHGKPWAPTQVVLRVCLLNKLFGVKIYCDILQRS